MADSSTDMTIRQLRDEISAVDRALVDAVNRRLELVGRLKRYKASRGMSFVDPEQERRLVGDLLEANRGPLSSEGLRELLGRVLELTKREVGRAETPRD